MNTRLKHYIQLAEVFDYPNEDFNTKILDVDLLIREHAPTAAKALQPFIEVMTNMDTLAQQELFIRSFDVQSLTTLDLGYVLFGDDYKRGELLVNLNREHRAVNNPCGNELADYLPNVLRLLPKLQDDSLTLELVEKIIAPALMSMIRAFAMDRVEKKENFYRKKYKTIIDRPAQHYTVYQCALQTLYLVLKQDFNFHATEMTEKTSDFLKNIETEILIEDDK